MELQLGQRVASEGGSHRWQLCQRSRVSWLAQAEAAKREICADFWATFTAERDSMPASVREIAEFRSIGDRPLQVLSRDPDPAVGWGSPESRRAWEEMQEELPKLSAQGRQRIVGGATHYIQDDRPEAVIAAIADMLGRQR